MASFGRLRHASLGRREVRTLRAIHLLAGDLRDYLERSEATRAEDYLDRAGLPVDDPGVENAIDRGMSWLCLAQDRSASQDGGVAARYSLKTGWEVSYPETTGYVIPTMFEYARLRRDAPKRERAKRMLDWLVSIQMPEGAYPSGVAGVKPRVPTVFNTGQVLLGLAAGVAELGEEYRPAMIRAADWLARVQDPDGCWRKYGSPLVAPGEKSYDTHAAWGLLEAARMEPDKPYAEAALANVRWALSQQHANGWFQKCCLSDPARPLTHTLGYALRGTIEAYRFARDEMFLAASLRAADGLLSALEPEGWLPGRLDHKWRRATSWVCLTGAVQIAICWMQLYRITGVGKYKDAGFLANKFVRRTMKISGSPDTLGAIKGSFPGWGRYGRHEFLNWACKFFVDANMKEKEVRGRESVSIQN